MDVPNGVPAGRPRIGFVGLGDMGGPIVRRIVAAGFPTTLWARRPSSLDALGGTAAASSPVELGRASDIACVCVFDDADVREVVLEPHGLLGGLAPGAVLVVHSTVAPGTCREIGEAAARRGVAVLDAPVSGGPSRAAAGALCAIVGGDAAVLDRVRPLLAAYAADVHHVGGLGAGMTAKLINNALYFAQLHLAGTALDIGEGLGVRRAALVEVLRSSSGASASLDSLVAMGDEPTRAEHVRAAAGKDVGILDALCRAAAVEPGLLGAAAAASAR